MATKIRETLSAAEIEALNARAVAYRDEHGLEDREALEAFLRSSESGLKMVREVGDCEIHQTADGRQVNVWLDATEGTIREGGLGFDDQTDWAETEDD